MSAIIKRMDRLVNEEQDDDRSDKYIVSRMIIMDSSRFIHRSAHGSIYQDANGTNQIRFWLA